MPDFPLNPNDILYQGLERSHDAFLLVDLNGTILYVNNAWVRLFGHSKLEAVGGSVGLLRSHHHEDSFYKRMRNDTHNSQIGFWRGELVLKAKNGREVPVLLTVTPFTGEEGSVVGYMGIASETTDRTRLEMEAIRKDRLNSIGILASGLAHEIGTPLGTVRGRAEHALGKLAPDSPARDDLNIIVTQVDRVSDLMHSLLDLAKDQNPDRAQVAFVQVVLEDVHNLVREKLEQRKITVHAEVDPNTKVGVPQGRLSQVFLNLFTNSLHAIELAIAAGRTQNHEIHVERMDRGSHWEVRVKDTGCGIPEQDFRQLFRPFFSTKDVGEGKGLGLAIAHQLVQSWGGSIHIDSQIGKGTTVTVMLPKAQ